MYINCTLCMHVHVHVQCICMLVQYDTIIQNLLFSVVIHVYIILFSCQIKFNIMVQYVCVTWPVHTCIQLSGKSSRLEIETS